MRRILIFIFSICVFSCANNVDAEKFYSQACEFYAAGDFNASLDALDCCKKANFNFAQEKFLRPKILFLQGEIAQSESIFSELARKNPAWTDARLWKIRCKIFLGKLDEAKNLLSREEKLNSSDWRVWYFSALLAECENNFSRQIACLRRARLHISDSAKVFGGQAKFYHALGDEKQAKENLEIAKTISGGNENFSTIFAEIEKKLDSQDLRQEN